MESLTDTDSVRGLGETTDFLNMTHVMKMDPSDKTLTLSPVQKDFTKPFAQTWSKGKEEEDEEEDEDEEEEEDNVDEDVEDEEEENDTSVEMEGPSSQSLEESTEKPAEETLSLKPEELKEESVPDGEQRAAEITEEPDTTAEEKTNDGSKPANGTTDSNSKSQSGSNKKLSLFRRLSFSRSKQTSDREQAPAEGTGGRDAAVQGEPPPPAAAGSSDRGKTQQRPRSEACAVL